MPEQALSEDEDLDEASVVLVPRLLEYGIPIADPWGNGFQYSMIFQGTDLLNERFPDHLHNWSAKQHAARIRHLMQSPEELEHPISLDSVCYGMHISCTPLIADGHHRMFAHLALKRPTIRAYFSGRLILLDYLTGATDLKPEED